MTLTAALETVLAIEEASLTDAEWYQVYRILDCRRRKLSITPGVVQDAIAVVKADRRTCEMVAHGGNCWNL